MKKISVIIPVYNTAEFLDECYQSIINQTHQNIEIIFIDDASTDKSYQKLIKFSKQNPKVSVYSFTKQMGVAKVRNFGITQATGNFYYFMDSDDVIEKHTLEYLVDAIGNAPFAVGKVRKLNDKNLEEARNAEVKEPNEIKRKDEFIKESVLNCLFSSSYIKKRKLTFDENVKYFCEYSWVVSMIKDIDQFIYVPDSIYFKRRRATVYNNPALFQKNVKRKIIDYLNIFAKLKIENPLDEPINNFLNQHFIKRYEASMVPYLSRRIRFVALFPYLTVAAKQFTKKEFAKIDRSVKKELLSLQKEDLELFQKRLRFRRRKTKFKLMFKGKRNFFTQIYHTLFCKLPLSNNTIIFESFMGKNYSDNPKAIYEYIQQNKLDYQCVWIFNKSRHKIPGKAIQVKRFSLRHFYYLAKAKYWIINTRMPKSINKRKKVIYLQTWHGTPLKKLGIDIDDVKMPGTNTVKYKKNFVYETERWNYLISPNSYSSKIFKQAFRFQRKLLRTGYPRNDVLVQKNNDRDIRILKEKMNLPESKKIILYAPTWRDDAYHSRGNYKFDIQLNIEQMQKQLGEDYILLLRMHYLIADNLDLDAYKGFAYDFSNYDDIAELYLVSDIMITDYSSVMFDYAVTKRPILFYTYDLPLYRDTLRGFYFDFENEAPGPLLNTTEEIIDSILHIEETKQLYKRNYYKFHRKFCKWEDGTSTQKVFETVFKKATKKQTVPKPVVENTPAVNEPVVNNVS